MVLRGLDDVSEIVMRARELGNLAQPPQTGSRALALGLREESPGVSCCSRESHQLQL